ncbi:MAG: LEA type 2 family protein [Steroidobacteraceae bacterium]
MRKWLGALVAGVAMLSGCASLLPKLEAPKLDVAGIAWKGGSMSRQKITVTLKVSNPNDRQISVSSIDCRIAVAGHDFASGATAKAFVVPALGDTQFDLDLTADLVTALQVLAEEQNSRDIAYRLTGELHLAAGLLRNVPFTKDGRIALRK